MSDPIDIKLARRVLAIKPYPPARRWTHITWEDVDALATQVEELAKRAEASERENAELHARVDGLRYKRDELAQEIERLRALIVGSSVELDPTLDEGIKAIKEAERRGDERMRERAAALVESIPNDETALGDACADAFNAAPTREMNARLVSWNSEIAKAIRALPFDEEPLSSPARTRPNDGERQ